MRAETTFITEGDNYYARAIRSIRAARHSVRLMVYIWQDDEIGRLFERALAQKASRGVDVEVVIDAVGSYELPASVADRLRKAGVEVFTHHRLRILNLAWFRFLIRRNHRKILLVDRRTAYTGGFNIMRQCSRKYFGQARWLDLVTVSTNEQIINFLEEQYIDACRRARHQKWATRLLLRSRNKVIVSQGPHAFAFSMSRWLKQKLRGARHKIVIAVPYFIPYGFFRRVLARKLREGLQVEIILSERSDLPWIDAISFSLARRLQKQGATVYLYHGEGETRRFSHTKFLQIDEWLGMGSANYDYRSMVLNLDTLIFFRKRQTTLLASYENLKQGSKIGSAELLRGGFRAWLLMPFRWLL